MSRKQSLAKKNRPYPDGDVNSLFQWYQYSN